MKHRNFLMTVTAGLMLATSVTAAAEPLSDEEKEQFLLQGEILKTKKPPVGTTGSRRATLRHGDLTHEAHLQTIDVFKAEFQTADGRQLNFRDSFKYNIAAYRLDRLINLNMVPVSVERRVMGKTGSVTWWVDDLQMMELDRYQKKLHAPNRAQWLDQMHNVRIFNELVYNTDPNLGNLLITNDWQLRLIDFSRAFRISTQLRKPENLGRIDQRVYDGLRALTREKVEAALSSCLRKSEIKGLMARKDRILEFFAAAIAEKGERRVVCMLQGH